MKQNAHIITPKNNNLVIGHDKAFNQLTHAFNSQKMHHAWLITGSKGIGKATLIYQFCNKLFGKNNAHNHPDLMIIEKKEGDKEISISEVRRLSHFLHLTPSASNYRVVIIDSSDELNSNSANALLKTLEEPPKNTFIFLICNKVGNIPITILSRCRKLKLHDLSKESALKVLLHVSANVQHEVAKKLLILADNSPSIALELEKIDGPKIYFDILHIINDSKYAHTSKIDKLLTALQKSNQPWQIFSFLLVHFITKLIKIKVKVQSQSIIDEQEEIIIKEMLTKVTAKGLLELLTQIEHHLKETEKANLDYKQMMLVIFNLIKSTISLQ